MAHMIDMSNNRANMAYVGEVPWHGLGYKLPANASMETWAEAAGLNWEALIKQPHAEFDGVFLPVPNQIMLLRNDTRAHLGSFTDNYVPTQPKDILAFFNDFVLADERFVLETAGCLKGGKVIWALARFQEDMDVVGEQHVPYVFLTTSFDGTRATTAQATMIRVVCANTLTASIFDKGAATVSVRHNKAFSGVVAEEAHKQLITVAQGFDRYKKLAETLVGIRMSRDTTKSFLKKLMEPAKKDESKADSKRHTNAMAVLYDCLNTTVREGTERDTAWAAFNAVTRYTDHSKGVKRAGGESENTARMTSSFFGDGAQLKSRALQGLLELV